MTDGLLARILATSPGEWSNAADFRSAWCAATRDLADPLHRALIGGGMADRLGYAFLAGYDAALHRLVPSLPVDTAAALCATEAGGAHPRAIRTTLREGRLNGTKRWSTLAGSGDVLFVLAAVGEREGRVDLRVAQVSARAPGVRLTAMPPTPFTPEIPHFSVELVDAPVDAVLPGDGWTDLVRPFRTIEDLHVLACTSACVLQVAGHQRWSQTHIARLATLIVAIEALSTLDRDAAGSHVAIAGCFELLEAALREAPWDTTDPAIAERWRRDLPLLKVAEGARAERTNRAFAALRG